MTTTHKLLRSVDGRQLPALGEVGVYWPLPDYTDIFSTEGLDADAYLASLNSEETPELIEHDAEATAKALLAALSALLEDTRSRTDFKSPSTTLKTRVIVGKAMLAVERATGDKDICADNAALTEHIKACEKHPMRQLEADKAALLDAIAEADDCREILGNLIDNIKSHGHYSVEATLVFLDQARSSLNPLQRAVEATRSN